MKLLRDPPDSSSATAYALSLASVIVAGVLRWLLDPVIGDNVPYITFFLAVVVAAWFGGLGPAVLATGLGFLIAWYVFIPPRFSIAIDSRADAISLAVYLVVALSIAGLSGILRAAQIRSRKAEQLTASQWETLRITLASIGDAVITTDAGGNVTYLNRVAENLTGWGQVDAVGMPLATVFNIINEQSRQPAENPVERVLQLGQVMGLANHTVLLGRDGTERPIDDSAAPIRDDGGRVIGVVLVFHDVSERRIADRDIRQREARKAAILETALDCIITIDHEGRIVEFNPAAERTFGFQKRDVLGRAMADLIVPPSYRERHFRGLAHYLATGEGPVMGRRIEMPALRADGSEIPVELAITAIQQDGPPLFTAYLRDLTQAKRIESRRTVRLAVTQILAEAETIREATPRIIRAVCESLGWDAGAIWHVDPSGNVLRCMDVWHRAAVRIDEFEATTQQRTFSRGVGLPGRIWASGQPAWIPDVVKDTNFPRGAIADQAGLHAAFGFPLVMGSDFLGVIEFFSHEIREPDADLLELMTTIGGQIGQFIERRRAEESLREADRRKTEFLATLGHELRNPLAPIRHAVEYLIAHGPPDPELVRFRRVIERQVGHMVRLIDDLLDAARISQGKLDLRREPVELAAVFQSAIETSRPLIEEKRHQLTVDSPTESIYLEGDLTRLAQVFVNLLNNAAKYTPPGGKIVLSAQRQGSDIAVSVRDNGIGIPPEHRSRVFEMFSQVDSALERTHGGLGIGLSLVRAVVELHGGTIEARSAGAGQGTEFIVRLPILVAPPVAPAPSRDEAPVIATPRRILLVDDNEDAVKMLGTLLRTAGHDTRTACDGLEAVEAAGQYRPEVVLLDIGLPKLNGYEACRRIRQQAWGKEMLIVAVTGWGQADDKRQAAEAGFDDHMTKPVDFRALQRLLAALLPEASSR